MLSRFIITVIFLFGFGVATHAGSFSFDHRHLIIPERCATDSHTETFVQDRYDRPVIADTNILKNIVREGSAFVYPSDYKDINLINDLLLIEDQASLNAQGCAWKTNPVQQADSITETGRFMIVTGKVLDIYESYDNIYLNFGPDWKTDFTVRIEKKNKTFKDVDFTQYKNKNVQVRGFVEFYNGPSLTLEHPVLLRIMK